MYDSYDNNYSNAGGFMSGSQAETSPSGGRTYDKDVLRSVTIKQIQEAQPGVKDDEFIIDGREATQFTFVAQIRNISVQATHTLYKLDDGTGTLEVKQWASADAMPDNTDLTENQYARVWGKIKLFNSRRNVNASFVRPVKDPNEIIYHPLQAIYEHLYFTRGPPEDNLAGSASQQPAAFGGAPDMGGNQATRGMSAAARKVYQALKTTPQNNEGLHMQDIASRLHMDTVEVAKAGDELLNGGLIYTTVNDETWNVLELD